MNVAAPRDSATTRHRQWRSPRRRWRCRQRADAGGRHRHRRQPPALRARHRARRATATTRLVGEGTSPVTNGDAGDPRSDRARQRSVHAAPACRRPGRERERGDDDRAGARPPARSGCSAADVPGSATSPMACTAHGRAHLRQSRDKARATSASAGGWGCGTLRIRTNRVLGTGVGAHGASGPQSYAQANFRSTEVSVTLPDGRRRRVRPGGLADVEHRLARLHAT